MKMMIVSEYSGNMLRKKSNDESRLRINVMKKTYRKNRSQDATLIVHIENPS